MKTILMDGNIVSNSLTVNLKNKISKLNSKIKIAIFKINDDKATNIYIYNKIKKCNYFNIGVELFEYDKNVNEETIIEDIKKCNNDKNINGIMVELPIYKTLNIKRILNNISPNKDIDGLTDTNMNKLINNEKCFIPCTVLGIEKLLNYYDIDTKNKRVTIINRSKLIGIPLYFRLLNKDCTVTICHSKSNNIDEMCRNSDIIVSAVGQKNLLNQKYVNDKSIIIDAGIVQIGNKIYGDTDFENVYNKCAYLTKVPGGIGPMTIISLIENLYYAYCIQNEEDDNYEKNN